MASGAKLQRQRMEYLDKLDVLYTIHNNGAHLIVEGWIELVDFWPGTGRWIARNGKRGWGVKSLVELIATETV